MPAKRSKTVTVAAPAAAAHNPGVALRALRRQRGWTLAEIGARTGLPISTLSKIENGKMSLSFDKLTRIAQGLEVDIGELFSSQPPAGNDAFGGRRSITRAGEGYAIRTENYDHLYPASELLNKRLVPIIVELHARSLEEFGELIRHTGEEFALVLEGAIELHTELYAPARLEAGDSIYFDSTMGHAYLAAAPGPCRVLAVCSGGEAHLREAMARQDVTRGARGRREDA
ncbi:helix-turn-helix transcriptional regulator [Lysobacter sp. K5869]|uniref:helix-turn-helix domain-containing protein n=1 Tax=Lysobacter sp. K5869 TaxID=2820808 RepID=UPI001C06177D|nr:XRE family transcriptional regulator [Lysobacter sp. K5869]QWP77287.1 helix-turn-helix transcriptional regulator [Lysobacter sp. K5869]